MTNFKYYLTFGIIFFTTSCRHSINVETTSRSSDLIHCENIFAEDLHSLKYESEILLQTGEVDTTDEQPPIPIAIVIINKREVILKLVSNVNKENETKRIYSGGDYKLTLNYQKEIDEHNETTFTGKIFIENNTN